MDSPGTEFDSLLPPLSLNRRGFLTTTLAGGFTLAAGPVMAQTAIRTGTDGLVAGEVRIPVRGGEIPAYRAAPAGKKNAPVVLVVQEIFGVHEYIRDVCRRWAKAGYLAVAPELYARQGDPSKYTEIARLSAEVVSKVPDDQVLADLDATARWAATHGGSRTRLGVTGFCWGGRIVWLYAAHNPAVKAGVAWYGKLVGDPTALQPLNPVDIAAQVKAPVLGLYGGQDAGIPPTSINAMKDALAKGGPAARESSFVLFRDAPHGFHADYRPSYREADAKEGWRLAQDWFARHL
ncbi:dienelactone hydrolase family protein [Pigmentiphaga sp. GD03639]|uniref:dienelactone hydrolase family protein n=1 Tax=unclassified Pigmentiphaga TaxID=2626614 RepID=UPI000B41EE29|nr:MULTISPECIES: dienelactone hydrolase family protein [unclassified Pigmentiphaga]MDH2239945.1 dienelactone hydrolase family protein [Pigmentiphaga sp. GD03639]OVZ62326.1 carboxymethylenebutenolidase [Pigmentiphaga sp. NML030171]